MAMFATSYFSCDRPAVKVRQTGLADPPADDPKMPYGIFLFDVEGHESFIAALELPVIIALAAQCRIALRRHMPMEDVDMYIRQAIYELLHHEEQLEDQD